MIKGFEGNSQFRHQFYSRLDAVYTLFLLVQGERAEHTTATYVYLSSTLNLSLPSLRVPCFTSMQHEN